MKAYIDVFRNYGNFNGFLKRGDYWKAVILHWLITLALNYHRLRAAFDSHYQMPGFYEQWGAPLLVFYSLLTVIPFWAATVRRLHSIPKSGWFILIGLIPAVGWIILLVNLLKKGNFELLERVLDKDPRGHAIMELSQRPQKGGWFFAVLAVLLLVFGYGFYCEGRFPNADLPIPNLFHAKTVEVKPTLPTGPATAATKAVEEEPEPIQTETHEPLAAFSPSYENRIDGSEVLAVTDGLYLSRYAVTVEQYLACEAEGACTLDPEPLWKSYVSDPEKAAFPMVNVTRKQAEDYCNWAGMRLPSSEEWFLAAEGSDNTNFDAINYAETDVFELGGTDPIRTIPVTAFEENASQYGMVQMLGNTWEWTTSGGVLGGAWNSYRDLFTGNEFVETDDEYFADNLGFRCAVTYEEMSQTAFDVPGVIAEPTPMPTPLPSDPSYENRVDGGTILKVEDDLYLSRYAVTVAQYLACEKDGVCTLNPEPLWKAYVSDPDKAAFPMVNVTREQAAAYCSWAGMRLPTDEEWLLASDGVDSTNLDVINFAETDVFELGGTDPIRTIPVQAFEENVSGYGQIQMLGNTWEWTTDSALGGSWNSYRDLFTGEERLDADDGYYADNLGFRCAVSPADISPEFFIIPDKTDEAEDAYSGGKHAQVGSASSSSSSSSVKTEEPKETEVPDDRAVIPGGSFIMGQAGGAINEKPEHSVTLSGYRIDKYEVTNAEYAACVSDGFCEKPAAVGTFRITDYYGNGAYDDYPVVNVTWKQAETYCEWLGGRLPTEAEWEHVARGADNTLYPWGISFDSSAANTAANAKYAPNPVDADEKDVSSFGVFDLGGNVQEWVYDRYAENWYTITDQTKDPIGPETGVYRVIRGASFQTGENYARAVNRFFAKEDTYTIDRGFRCVIPTGK